MCVLIDNSVIAFPWQPTSTARQVYTCPAGQYRAALWSDVDVRQVSGRYTYPIHTGDGRYTYRAGSRASSCVAALTREWPLTSRFTIYSSHL